MVKTARFVAFLVIGVLITVNLLIVLSGRFYLYKGIANTYLSGHTGPTIYDLEVFPYSTVNKGDSTFSLFEHPLKNTEKLNQAERAFLEELDTRALLIFHGDTLLYEEYWEEHASSTVSNSFSIAKTVVALLVGIAVEEGYIKSLDDPASRYLPEFRREELDRITVRHLLAMASGLDWEESSKNPLSDNAESYYGSELRRLVTHQKVVRKPGELFKYQSGNSQLLGYIVEEATGQDLSAYASEKIWKKIGAEQPAFWSLDRKGGDEKAFCCLYATARDYGRLGQLILNKGKWKGTQVVPLWFFHEMVSPSALHTEDGFLNSRYGLHIWTYREKEGQVNYCRGINGQYIIAIPSEDLLVIRLGEKRRSNYAIPSSKMRDTVFLNENQHKVGHSSDLFEYIALGKSIKTKMRAK